MEMIENIVLYLQQSVLPYGALGVFLASIAEEIIAPIPSALVLTASGFFLITASWLPAVFRDLFFIVALPGALGITIGSLLLYGIGYGGGKPLLLRWGSFFGLSWSEIEKMERRFKRGYSDEITLFIARAIPVIPSSVISAFCGLIRLPLREYLIFSFLGTSVRAFILAFIGWQVGGLYGHFAGLINRIENYVFIIIIFSVILFIGYKIAKKA